MTYQNRDAHAFRLKTVAYATALPIALRAAVFESSMLVKTTAEGFGLKGTLRNVGKKGARIGVRFDIKGVNNPTALVRAYGPAHLIERDTAPHRMDRRTGFVYKKTRDEVTGKRRNVRTDVRFDRASTRFIQVIPGVGPRNAKGFKLHPGTKGKHPWNRAVMASKPLIPSVFARNVGTSLVRTFSGT